MSQKKVHPQEKTVLHARNKHRGRYDFKQLIESFPALQSFVKVNAYGDESIDFFDPEAVKHLNRALLKCFYKVEFWDIPAGYLCPPIPGRADYVHYVADLLSADNAGIVPRGNVISCVDIGVGANCIYPIIGAVEYGWTFVGTDADATAITSASEIIERNPFLQRRIALRLQPSTDHIFQNVVKDDEGFDVTFCNPPFHTSAEEAQAGSLKKLSNLKRRPISKAVLNFGGKGNELWCTGGEERFVGNIIRESRRFAKTCLWFTTLISKQSNLDAAVRAIRSNKAADVKVIPMSQGNKSSRIVAWTYHTTPQRQQWASTKWNPGD
ncbi:23S rRNA (adenine(1618)-N(6))-methyltransferase RlmF [Pseudochryseolinea flava]|uniref:Ribosomal RNA large subunit methyltransferase F n=1 Tax=Pseudochryseolinea flava TaxID=2059302 RepID=A0A364Y5L2_9BACT|nr:23S rRNA (adenine(1618)-N(6))-methyltransferase RlmF [Pseudochryseolinea flava]RAW02243.1 23S rRNA (adenine(1618)-N(6))-methyltransferase RlmF [Pseudochryseolinea flava]